MDTIPSSYQEAIYRFALKGSGHGVIMATAGSGKSTTLVEVAHRLPEGTCACFLAFNKSAAQQLKDRLPGHVTACTVHALGLRTLAASVKGRKLARVYPRKYQELVRARLRNTEESYRVSSQTASQAVQYLRELTHYAHVNLAQEKDRGVLERLAQRYHLRPPDHPELLSNLHAQLREILRDGMALALNGLYDYTDMIYAPVAADLPPTRRFDMVCVDEAQDLSPMQLAFILRLPCPSGRRCKQAQVLGWNIAGKLVSRVIRSAGACLALSLPSSFLKATSPGASRRRRLDLPHSSGS